MNEETIASMLQGMLSQEDFYTCHDYILEDHNADAHWMTCRVSLLNTEDLELNRSFRSRMISWAYEVIRFSKFQRETAEFATSYFDRFVQTKHGEEALHDRVAFQLAYVTCLFMATKLHEPITMSPAFFSILSRDKFSMEEIQKMELTILSALQWRINPPTALAFAQHFIALHPLNRQIEASVRDAIYDLAKVQIELMVDDYQFVSVPRSTIALAALINSLDSLQIDPNGWGVTQLMSQANMNKNMEEVEWVRDGLYHVISKLPHQVAKCLPKALCGSSYRGMGMASEQASCQQSPRSVYHTGTC